MMIGVDRLHRLLILTPWLLWFPPVGHRWLFECVQESADLTVNVFPYAPNDPPMPRKMAQFIVINSPFSGIGLSCLHTNYKKISFYWNWIMKMTDTTASWHKISRLKLMDKNEAVHVYGTKLAHIIHSLGSTGQEKVVTFFMATLFL
jgi:hypothetical protein